MTRETREAFRAAIKALFETIRRCTGRAVSFYFLHQEGLWTIVVDGNSAQISAFGDYFAELHALLPQNQHVQNAVAADFIASIMKLCSVHNMR